MKYPAAIALCALVIAWPLVKADGPGKARPKPPVVPGISAAAFSWDGKYLLIGYHTPEPGKRPLLEVWNVEKREFQLSCYDAKQSIKSVVFLPGDEQALSQDDPGGTFRLWKVQTGKELQSFPATLGALSPDHKTLLTWLKDKSQDKAHKFVLWDVAEGNKLETFDGTGVTVDRLWFEPDGKSMVLACRSLPGEDGRSKTEIRPLDLATGKIGKPIRDFIYRGVSSPDGRYQVKDECDYSPNFDPDAKARLVLWDVKKQKIAMNLEERGKGGPSESNTLGYATVIAFSKDVTAIVTGDRDGMLRRWDIKTGKLVWAVEAGSVRAISPDGDLAFSIMLDDGERIRPLKLCIWDATKGKMLRTLRTSANDPAT
jgi:WD40 repeat protein